jgi:hypothetical protein
LVAWAVWVTIAIFVRLHWTMRLHFIWNEDWTDMTCKQTAQLILLWKFRWSYPWNRAYCLTSLTFALMNFASIFIIDGQKKIPLKLSIKVIKNLLSGINVIKFMFKITKNVN